MDNSLLLNSIAKYVTLDESEQAHLLSVVQHKKAKRKQFILEEGDISSRIVFVTSGCLRSYAVDKNGTEHVLQFAPAGWWIVDMRSYVTAEPARLNIDAIEDSEYLFFNKPDFEELNLTIPGFERFNRIIGQNAIATFQHRQIDNAIFSAMERYANFCQLYPSLIKTLPQKQVASYIGVTPEFLSKMLNTQIVK
ncbi:Crp/Fnr family transcriptional regulator [Mucilaginibacter phyllosphaerae]|uniref:CRP-like cAMP-binding protein n=1 Tax=Mucilaginibacter phyllosphaerae TaxID=1812349 RepID=A0A4Y8AK07_9SPHI|nr:Crp/Fnr family transcriptional regulator [Mucilaginibacter phyllosphaerae]MBB3968127.1 CRP-like cAMP-binding protein [Mucilaginibacter phyllosphaerae]TEW68855.1 Crp/Fnr family transcriptional regulator [Mucilaginibacter phyllosphaerae]GGH01071.1 cAMP-binding protein [Mucilaginibacter phyllosphaerae]